MHREAPGIIVIANPDIMALQSDRATPGAARTITLRPGCWWKSCIRETSVHQRLKNGEMEEDNVSIPTEAAPRRSDCTSRKRKGLLADAWEKKAGFFSDTFRAFPFNILIYLKTLKVFLAKQKKKSNNNNNKSRNFSAGRSRTF